MSSSHAVPVPAGKLDLSARNLLFGFVGNDFASHSFTRQLTLGGPEYFD